MVRTLLGMQSAKLKFWALFERQSRFIHSMGVVDFDYWLLPFILRLKRGITLLVLSSVQKIISFEYLIICRSFRSHKRRT